MRLALNFPSWSPSSMTAPSQRRLWSVFSSTFSTNAPCSSPWRASSPIDAVVTSQLFEATADTRKRSTDALSSTSRTRSVSAWISPAPSICTAALVVTDPLLGPGRTPVPSLRPAELVEELEPLTRETVFREVQRLELRTVRGGLQGLRRGRRRGLRPWNRDLCRGRGGRPHRPLCRRCGPQIGRRGRRLRRCRYGRRRGCVGGRRALRRLREEVRPPADRLPDSVGRGLRPRWQRSLGRRRFDRGWPGLFDGRDGLFDGGRRLLLGCVFFSRHLERRRHLLGGRRFPSRRQLRGEQALQGRHLHGE